METRPASGVPHAVVAPARLDLGPVRGAVRTDLAPPIAIAAQAGSEQTRLTRERRRDDGEQPKKSTETSFSTDRETGELVFQVMDSTTHDVVAQYPYDSLLKLRAYIRAADERAHQEE